MGVTTVYVTHGQIEALTLATKIAVLKDGVLQQFRTPDEIDNNPENLFVAEFMGSPSMNTMTCVVEADGQGLSVELSRTDGTMLRLGLPQTAGLQGRVGQKVIFGLRPGASTDLESADRVTGRIVEADCLIEVVEPAGAAL